MSARMQQRRVLVVSGADFVGGAEVGLLRVLARLPRDRVQVRVAIVAPSGGDLEPALRALGLTVDVLPVSRIRHPLPTARAIGHLTRIARGADLLHANDVRSATVCQLVSLVARRPWTWRVQDLVQGATPFEKALRWTRPTRILPISDACRRAAIAYGGWPEDHFDLVRYGVDAAGQAAQASRAVFRAEQRLAEEDLAVGIVGRLISWKGQDDFLRAGALVAPRVPRARFFIVGAVVGDAVTNARVGDERARLERLAAELGIAARVVFTGERRDVPTIMAGLDLFVLASHAEPFGLVLLEAMSQGTAIVATRAGGAEEVVLDGETGLLVPPRSPERLAEAVATVLLDAERRRCYGAAGLERARSVFTLDNEARGLLDSWERALESTTR